MKVSGVGGGSCSATVEESCEMPYAQNKFADSREGNIMDELNRGL